MPSEERLTRARAPTIASLLEGSTATTIAVRKKRQLMQCNRFETTCKDAKLQEAGGGTISYIFAEDNKDYFHIDLNLC